MEVIIRPNEAAAAALTARLIAESIQDKHDLVLGLATGRTMESVYARLAEMHKNDGLNFSACRTFNLDEYVGLPADDPNSYRSYMNDRLFNLINIDPRNTYLPDGMAEDLAQECQLYEERIEACGGIDLQLLGVGESGHIGFNEPLSALLSRTRQKALNKVTIAQNSPLFDPPSKMPRRALTMGVGTILDARRIIMLVTGANKAQILAKSVEGPITSMISATALQLHPATIIICDEAAAAKLEHKEYYNWVFANEPEWELYR
ncbi:MAG: glucosamine-6-phosphate deaminase [Kiritimatiellae bacterium]|nr:glucosamine-6-phosphate deaminase [Kiritimatiellia bacterium]